MLISYMNIYDISLYYRIPKRIREWSHTNTFRSGLFGIWDCGEKDGYIQLYKHEGVVKKYRQKLAFCRDLSMSK